MHLLLGRQIADPVIIQDARPKRCIVVSISVDVTNDKGWWGCSRPRSKSAFPWLVVPWILFSSADLPEKHVDVIVFFLLRLW